MKVRPIKLVAVCDWCPAQVTHLSLDHGVKACDKHAAIHMLGMRLAR